MAKKGNRIQVILECTEHKASGKPGTSRYVTTKNKKNTPDRIELKKYNPNLFFLFCFEKKSIYYIFYFLLKNYHRKPIDRYF